VGGYGIEGFPAGVDMVDVLPGPTLEGVGSRTPEKRNIYYTPPEE
jgi:hypothetical protein